MIYINNINYMFKIIFIIIFYSSLTQKPVFNVNGKNKFVSQRHRTQEVITPQHEELIKYVHECELINFFMSVNIIVYLFMTFIYLFCIFNSAWNEVEDTAKSSEEMSSTEAVYYNDGEPNDVLRGNKIIFYCFIIYVAIYFC